VHILDAKESKTWLLISESAGDRMGEEETLLASEEALAHLERIERLLETIAENLQEYLETSRQLLASPALKAEGSVGDLRPTEAQVKDSRVAYSADQSQALIIREVTINPAQHVVTLCDQPIELTPTEFDILFCLMRSAGRVLSCQELVREAQGYELDERDARYLIRPHITRLRQKLVTEPGAPEFIHNVRGVGYFFERRTRQRN
jgi:DNA-binding response OmpR family regulator